MSEADDHLILTELKRRREKRTIYLATVALVAATLVGLQIWMNFSPWIIALTFIPIFGVYVCAVLITKELALNRAQTLRAASLSSEQLQATRLRFLSLMPFILLLQGFAISGAMRDFEQHRADRTSWFSLISPALMCLAFVLYILGIGVGVGRVMNLALNDELTQLHRSYAVRSAIVVMMIGALAAWLIGFINPHWTQVGLPLAVWAAMSVMAWHFAWLERRANGFG